ncbi:MAG TPA: M15 family metallopeptidase [Frankiaceae bacterium]|nr:M15 family metallopeptidase [Frankiaceae bacterium]
MSPPLSSRAPLRRLLPALVPLVAALVLGGGWPASAYSGTNGRLDPATLARVTPSCLLVRPAAGPMRRMIADARRHGVRLVPGQCYRTYASQVYWRRYWCARGQCWMAAVPGYSRHGWAKAVDFRGMTFRSAGFRWLSRNAHRYGFVHPSWAREGRRGAEPWHWEWSR